MNSRERVLRAIQFDTPDRVPIGYSINPGALLRHGQKLIDLCTRYPHDFFDPAEVIRMPERDTANYREDGSYYKELTDEWGCTWVCYKEGISGEVKRSPLDDWSKLEDYRFPPVPNASPEERAPARETTKQQMERFIGWGAAGSLFEQMQWLRGVEKMMMDIALDCEEAYLLVDRMMDEWIVPHIELALEAGAEAIGFGDDWGTQERLLSNPKSWREIFKPRYQRAIDLAHEGGALTWLHSDGMILEILPDLIEIGLDVINPQLSCLNLDALRSITDHRICVYTDMDRQFILPRGTPAQVREHVRDAHSCLASPDGGLIWGAGIYEDVPFENIEALLEAFVEFG